MGSSMPSPMHNASYVTALAFDPVTGVLDGTHHFSPDFMTRHPFMFKAKATSDPDTPTFREAMTGPHSDEFLKAMATEIEELIEHGCWDVIKRKDIPPIIKATGDTYIPAVIPTTWAFKIKRWPTGLFRKVKARFCVRGDLQKDGVDVFDTYAPVASWSSIRMLMTIALHKKWVTKQIDFSNAFVQASLPHPVYVALPAMFHDSSGIPTNELCLKLQKSLYGQRDAPKLWSDHLKRGLLRANLHPSAEDPAIYLGRGMAIAVYVDDVLFFGPDEAEMEKVINELQDDNFQLKREKDGDDPVYNFLGLQISEHKNGGLQLTQHGLIKKFLNTVDMVDCNPTSTPCTKAPLRTDPEGAFHSESWSYASAVGMLMYLASNAHPELAYAVHQCARFTHNPKTSHTAGIKRIARYLKGILTNNEGLIIKPTDDMSLDCYVDADFAGLWSYEDDQDPVCVRSRTGYVMTLGGCPIHWVSKLQTEIALSTVEAEYIALSQSMRELLPMHRMFTQLSTDLDLSTGTSISLKSTIFEDNNGAISVATAPKMSPRTKHIAVKYHFVKSFFGPDRPAQCPFFLEKIDTSIQKADIFTKGLDSVTFSAIQNLLCKY